MTQYHEIAEMVAAQGAALDAFQAKHAARVDELAARLDADDLKAARAPFTAQGTGTPKVEQWLDVKSKRLVPVLSAEHSLAALDGRKADTPSLGRFLRGAIMGSRADDAAELADERKALRIAEDPAGGFTTTGTLASEWVDLLRANSVLSKAGVRTVPMDSKSLTLARLTGDPTVAWHAENAALTASDPTFGAVTLNAKTAVVLVKLSLELSQDSINIEDILQRSLVQAMAGAIDDAGLNGVEVGAASAPSGIFSLSGRNSVTSIGAPTNYDFIVDAVYELMADNVAQESIGAMIGHPLLWKKLSKMKTGLASDQTTLMMPSEVAKVPRLWTTNCPSTSAVMGNWTDYLMGIRKDISVKVLAETYLGSNLQVALLCYARCDFAATRAASFVTMEGITVA